VLLAMALRMMRSSKSAQFDAGLFFRRGVRDNSGVMAQLLCIRPRGWRRVIGDTLPWIGSNVRWTSYFEGQLVAIGLDGTAAAQQHVKTVEDRFHWWPPKTKTRKGNSLPFRVLD
jgi:hypothetical protein